MIYYIFFDKHCLLPGVGKVRVTRAAPGKPNNTSQHRRRDFKTMITVHATPPRNLTRHRLLRFFQVLVTATLLSSMSVAALAVGDTGRVITTIQPLHSLVSAVMAGAGTPHLMIRGATSPHHFSLRPSDAAVLEGADLVFMIDESFETPLVKPVHALASSARVVLLSDAEGLTLKPRREGETFEEHDRTDSGHHEEGEHHEEDEHSEDHDHHAHEHGVYDMHIWLDPENAAAMVRMIADVLIEVDPAHGETYAANADRLLHRLQALTAEIAQEMEPVRDKPFVVLHDAYQYFENRFGLSATGSVMMDDAESPSAKRIQKLRNKVRELGAVCVFAEPQFNSSLVDVVIENTPVRSGILDPLGATIESGPEAYFTLIRDMARSFADCLGSADQQS